MPVRFAAPGGRTEPPNADDAAAWITGAVPDSWFTEAPEVVIDRDEIIIWGRLPRPDLPEDATDADRAAGQAGRISGFREETREARIRVARQVEHRYQRKVAWGTRCGETSELFTHLSAPVMTRLRQPERQVLDTLVDAGVARSRSEALAWCVKLVGRHTEDWLEELRSAMTRVDELRRRGPEA
ncbi:hypothetical protein GCM10010112_00870 [Actinoplanes lobatus]|uniref:Smu12A n=1 Tax=Actinoplanes lobatus TaxID=113568 RepID=A0A7W7MDT2_9ACTN|nr:hypothetical protein [Actinoplanes lobatus]MBB4746508.1 hypothetical protein [Actinoplanes lobatus]GGN52789.1 hypothetical protein GCM10010112_00870 [Actinoplanes lobatus]GIE45079.1 hypothetical protein Alo02nite_79770 [Actinoplanes lobatus]